MPSGGTFRRTVGGRLRAFCLPPDGPDYARMDNFKRKFRLVLRDVKAVYPDARFETDDHDLFHSSPPVRRRLIPAG